MSVEKTLKSFIVLTQAQFNARQQAGTLQEGVEYLIKDYQEPVQGVKINGTSIVDANGVANIPKAAVGVYGVITFDASMGIDYTNDGKPKINAANDALIEAKTNAFRPIVPATLDKAIMEGLGNNSLTWSSAYKAAARNTIGAVALEEYNSSAASYADGVLYYVVD